MDLVKNLILEIISFLENNLETKPEIELLKSIKNVSLRKDNFVSQMLNFPPKERALSDAISSIESSELLGIKESLERVIGDLRWNIDDGDFYEKDSEIGESYLLGNMNCDICSSMARSGFQAPIQPEALPPHRPSPASLHQRKTPDPQH
mgnify:CR=1 FL=1